MKGPMMLSMKSTLQRCRLLKIFIFTLIALLLSSAYVYSVRPQNIGSPVCVKWVVEEIGQDNPAISHCAEWSR